MIELYNRKIYKTKSKTCKITTIHIRIHDVEEYAKHLIEYIQDTSWITKLGLVDQISFKARSKRTVSKLCNEIFVITSSDIGTGFGEYLISLSALEILKTNYGHVPIPLAELIKEKVIGNPGFDFHTESSLNNIIFGEAKYSGVKPPYNKALKQINDFINKSKDDAELTLLEKFISAYAIHNALNGKKGYAAAFSLLNNSKSIHIFENILKSAHLKKLLAYPEIYLIGVEVID